MIIPDKYENLATQNALVIVSSKEHGVIYQLSDGTIEPLDHLTETEPTRSDDEGFFFKAAAGANMQGGSPKENQDDVYKQKLDTAIGTELTTLIARLEPTILYIFEPEHYKGRIEGQLGNHPELHVHTVRYGNYVSEPLETLLRYIHEYAENQTPDPDEVDFEHDLKTSS